MSFLRDCYPFLTGCLRGGLVLPQGFLKGILLCLKAFLRGSYHPSHEGSFSGWKLPFFKTLRGYSGMIKPQDFIFSNHKFPKN